MGTEVRFMDTDSYDDIYREMDRLGAELGKPYYNIPCGGSNALGALGYISCMREIAESGVPFTHIVCAEGSGGTHAGTALGAKLYLSGASVTGVKVSNENFEQITPAIMRGAAELLELKLDNIDFSLEHLDMCGPGYALPSPEGNAAIRLMAGEEGIFLDPVYTGKAFAGLLEMAKAGRFCPEDNVLFLHTGGAGGLFAIDALMM